MGKVLEMEMIVRTNSKRKVWKGYRRKGEKFFQKVLARMELVGYYEGTFRENRKQHNVLQ